MKERKKVTLLVKLDRINEYERKKVTLLVKLDRIYQ